MQALNDTAVLVYESEMQEHWLGIRLSLRAPHSLEWCITKAVSGISRGPAPSQVLRLR